MTRTSRRGPQALALRAFARLPRAWRLRIVRLVAPSYTVGALCVVEHEGRYLMLRQLHRPGWTLPGGLLARGEAPAEAAVRELAEETGLRADVGRPVVTVVAPRVRRVDIIFHIATARRPDVTAGSEALSAAWLTPEEAAPLDDPTARALATLRSALTSAPARGRLL